MLERVGVKRSARDVMPVGLDQLMVGRPMRLTKAMADDTLLVRITRSGCGRLTTGATPSLMPFNEQGYL